MPEKQITPAQKNKAPDGGFSIMMGNTTYQIGVHFSETSRETLDDKVRRLIRQDVKMTASNFFAFDSSGIIVGPKLRLAQ